MRNDIAVEKLWLDFSNVPVNYESNTIDTMFRKWKKGTDISIIRGWFNTHHSQGLIEGLVSSDGIEMEKRVNIYEKKLELLQNICSWFNYKLKIYEDGFIQYVYKNVGDAPSKLTVRNVDDALSQWAYTITQNQNYIKDKIIDLIENLNEKGVKYDEAKEWQDIFYLINIDVRVCSICGKIMYEGYCINGGDRYYCDDGCRSTEMTEEEFNDLFNDGYNDTYWTEWL